MSLAPPRDPHAERDFSPSLRAALDEYIALERRVRPVASGRCASTCAACRSPCCKSVFCSEAWKTPWLRAATARRSAVRKVPDAMAIEGHLSRDGCRLQFGRPPVCYEFACSDVLGGFGGDPEKYLFRVVSHIMTFAGEGALPKCHLVEVLDLADLDESRVSRLRERIALSGMVFDAAVRLLDALDAAGPESGAREGSPDDWAFVESHFPTKGYRLSPLAAAREPARLKALGATSSLKSLPIVSALAPAAKRARRPASSGKGR